MKRLHLIDGTALIYRSFYAFVNNPLRNSAGENTSAIYGVINSFLKLMQTQKVTNCIVSFDLKDETFRHRLSDTYKANRPPAPDELISQVEAVKEFFSSLDIPEVSLSGYEADDILGTLATKLQSECEVVLVTGDKDFSQLVNDRVSIYDPFSDKTITAEIINEKYGVSPNQFVDYLAIIGDSSDNIPGVKGIGAKGAKTLLNEFSDLDTIYINIDHISPPGVKNKLIEGKDDAYLSRELAQIVLNVPLKERLNTDMQELFSNSELDYSKFKKLMQYLEKYEMKSFLSRFKKLIPETEEFADYTDGDTKQLAFSFYEETNKIDYSIKIVDNESELNSLFEALKESKFIALDTETSSLDSLEAELVGLALSTDKANAFYIPVGQTEGKNIAPKLLLAKLNQIPAETLLIGHNLKFDLVILERLGFSPANRLFDTMIASYILDTANPRHSLDVCAKRELGIDKIPLTELIGSGKKQISFAEVEIQKAAEYAAEDANVTYRLYEIYIKKIEENSLQRIFYEVDLPLLTVLGKMERHGVFIDCEILQVINEKISIEIERLTVEVYKLTGEEFNLNSTQQLGKVLFEEMKIPPVKKTKTGYSTDNYVLETLAEEYEIAGLLIEYRQLAKLKSTYVESLPQLINKNTGRIHSSFNQTITSTGRLSSTNPNLQNIPIRSKVGKEIRKAFVAEDKDSLILSADYSQIELRILGILSKDRNLITAFNHNQDIHAQTAGLILNKPITMVDQDERRMAKAINFGIIYGMGANKLARETNISQSEAKEFIEAYFKKFGQIRDYLDSQKRKARKYGYAETIMGRRLYLPNILSNSPKFKSEAERVAVNMPIQGSAADIIKMAMIRLDKELNALNSKYDKPVAKMLIQVHDELVFEVKDSHLEKVREIVIKEMKYALPERYRIIIPLAVDTGSGKNWFEAHS